jgi:hypothetical protein
MGGIGSTGRGGGRRKEKGGGGKEEEDGFRSEDSIPTKRTTLFAKNS